MLAANVPEPVTATATFIRESIFRAIHRPMMGETENRVFYGLAIGVANYFPISLDD